MGALNPFDEEEFLGVFFGGVFFPENYVQSDVTFISFWY